ncbi:MAG TPA: hypothetical protein VFA85_11205 [Terriglobales bacterium]|nr:hypothetical protein [Terriglobales bacterium]
MATNHSRSFFHHHSLSIVSALILLCWIVLYIHSNPGKHWGGFFGNAIADWTGMVVTVLATKFMYEKGSAESRKPPQWLGNPVWAKLFEHSLSIFLGITGIGWIFLYASMDANSKWGQVVGNIVSEWTQIFGLLILTKKLVETHSKESRR